MRSTHTVGTVALAMAFAIAAGACSSAAQPDEDGPAGSPGLSERATIDSGLGETGAAGPDLDATAATVLRVEDGDSLVVEIEGSPERVRLIGINTPERDECLGAEAREALTELIANRDVLVEFDVKRTDQYGRLLAYVWFDGDLINAEMAARGLAIARAFEPNTSRQDTLDAAEVAARAASAGVWDPLACGGDEPAAMLKILTVVNNPPGRDEANLNGEFVVIENQGAAADLSGFVLRDGSSVNRYTFPVGFVVEGGASVTVFVGCGRDTAEALYWCAQGPVWDNGGDQAFMVSPGGAFIDVYEYP